MPTPLPSSASAHERRPTPPPPSFLPLAGAVLSASVLGIRTVAAFSLEVPMHSKYVEVYQITLRKRLKEAAMGGLMLGYTLVVQYGTNGLLFYVAGQLIKNGDATFIKVMEAIMTLMLGCVA